MKERQTHKKLVFSVLGDFSAFGSADLEKKETKEGKNDNKKEIKNAVIKHYLMLTIKSDMCEINIK